MPRVRHHPAAIALATLIYFFLGPAWFTTFMNPGSPEPAAQWLN
jgi:hypothetical protein